MPRLLRWTDGNIRSLGNVRCGGPFRHRNVKDLRLGNGRMGFHYPEAENMCNALNAIAFAHNVNTYRSVVFVAYISLCDHNKCTAITLFTRQHAFATIHCYHYTIPVLRSIVSERDIIIIICSTSGVVMILFWGKSLIFCWIHIKSHLASYKALINLCKHTSVHSWHIKLFNF